MKIDTIVPSTGFVLRSSDGVRSSNRVVVAFAIDDKQVAHPISVGRDGSSKIDVPEGFTLNHSEIDPVDLKLLHYEPFVEPEMASTNDLSRVNCVRCLTSAGHIQKRDAEGHLEPH